MFLEASEMLSGNHATIAAFFLHGIEAGLITDIEVKNWAFSVIETLDHPPVEIIEVAESHGLRMIYESLRSVTGQPDTQLAGRWLLAKLRDEVSDNKIKIEAAAKKAMQIARVTSLPDDAYYHFDTIEDGIFLAKNNIYGDVDTCKKDLIDALTQYGQPQNDKT